jgi:hypothetical protein
MKRTYCITYVAAILFVLLLCATAFGIEATRFDRAPNSEQTMEEPVAQASSPTTYTGTIRIFVTDNDLWNDNAGVRFHNAVVGIPLQQSFSLADGDSLEWDTEFNYYYLTEQSAVVVAAVYNSYGYQGYSVPPSSNPFTVHEVDAAAEAGCGRTGYNIAAGGFTHTVLVEEGATST